MNLADRSHSIYVMWADELCVYVGMTSQWEQRLREHGVWWGREPLTMWTSQRLDSEPITHIDVWEVNVNRHEARALERDLIRALLPTHNRDGKPRAAA